MKFSAFGFGFGVYYCQEKQISFSSLKLEVLVPENDIFLMMVVLGPMLNVYDLLAIHRYPSHFYVDDNPFSVNDFQVWSELHSICAVHGFENHACLLRYRVLSWAYCRKGSHISQ